MSRPKRTQKAEQSATESKSFISKTSHRLISIQTTLLEKAAAAFHHGFWLASVVGRELEVQLIEKSIKRSLEDNRKALFIFGAPGTGKTSSVRAVLESLDKETTDLLSPDWHPHTSFLNCALFRSLHSLLTAILQTTRTSKKAETELIRICDECGLDEAFAFLSGRVKRGKTAIVVLDEVDQLNGIPFKGRNSLVEELMRLSSQESSNIVVIAISNSVSLGAGSSGPLQTRRRLRKNSLPPVEMVVFEVYSPQQLSQIVHKRLDLVKQETLSELHICPGDEEWKIVEEFQPFDEMALTLLLKKLATLQGDCRQTLDACRKLLADKCSLRSKSSRDEHPHESPTKKKKFPVDEFVIYCDDSSAGSVDSTIQRNQRSNSTTSTTSSITPTSPSELPTPTEDFFSLPGQVEKISLQDAQRTLSQQFQKCKTRHLDLLRKFPLHQQILLCAVCVAARGMNCVDVNAVQIKYNEICESHQVRKEFEFAANLRDGLVGLEETGVIKRHIPKFVSARPGVARARKSNSSKRIIAPPTDQLELLLDHQETEEVLSELKSIFKTVLQE